MKMSRPITRAIVMLVDDNVAVRELVTQALEARGYVVVAITDRVSALRAVATRRPAAILLNLGLQSEAELFARALMRTPLPHAPLIAFRASGAAAAPPGIAQVAEVGNVCTIPARLGELVALVERLTHNTLREPLG
jgi:CheY-like chemotaxis protein